MNLQSDNAVIKRPKHSLSPIINKVKQEECEEGDIISRLPDEILTHILSLLPDADAYKTRILSNRWNHLCFSLPFLHFKMPSSYKQTADVINKFYDFVDKTFSLRSQDIPIIKRFFLSCSYRYDHNRVLHWIHIVFRCKHIETIELRFPSDRDRFSLSWDLLNTCENTLVDLTLENVNMVGFDETRLLFKCLKRLKLVSIEYSGDQSLQNLVSSCPVLQDLFLDHQKVHSQLQTLKISSPSMKRLRIHMCVFGKRCEVVIDAPKLEYFYIREDESATYSLTNPSSLVEAHINIYIDSNIHLLTNVSSARILTLGKDSVLGLHRNPRLNVPVFPNFLKSIVNFDDIPAWDVLFILLKSMPNLQHIAIDFGELHLPFKRGWNPPRVAPSCLRFMVKEIFILNKDAVQVKDHVALISYLLKHSSVLEKMTLNSHYLDREKREKLLNMSRRSKSCRIEFV